MSPDTLTAPYRHHAACRQTTVRPPAHRTSTSRAKQPAEGRAQLAEKARNALGVKDWLQQQRAHAPAARRQRPLLWRSPRGVLRRGSARPSCAQWAHRKLSGQPLGATEAGAGAGSVARARTQKSILEGAISASVRGGPHALQSSAARRMSTCEGWGRCHHSR